MSDASPKITVTAKGPYLVSGSVPLEIQSMEPVEGGDSWEWRPGAKLEAKERYALCRCGESQTKPYCDGTHARTGFVATGEPATGDVAPLAARDGKVAIQPLPGGPLVVSGNLEVISGTGRTIRKATSLALCRCGASANKPFCDGSHNGVTFDA